MTDVGELSGVLRQREAKLTDVSAQEDLEERSRKIIDSLNVSTRWMSQSPDIEYPFQGL